MFENLKITDHHIYRGTLPKMSAVAYQYLLAGNGVFVQAQNRHWQAVIPVQSAEINGLPSLNPQVVCRHGKIPSSLLGHLLPDARRSRAERGGLAEALYRIEFSKGKWKLRKPVQEATACSVVTETPLNENTVVELHTHGKYSACFSATDNEDERGLLLYGVIGELNRPITKLRARFGIYGHMHEFSVLSLFSAEQWPQDLSHEYPD